MIIGQTERLTIRDWQAGDRDLFREINADAKVMEFFPFQRSHAEADALLEKLNRRVKESGLGFYALALRENDEPIGFCGLAVVDLDNIFPPGTVEIGWRLATRFWGNGYVTEAANMLLAYGFNERNISEIVSFAVAGNRRSIAVMERIGMRHEPGRDFDHPKVPDTHPHLKRHVVYSLTRQQWQQKAGS